MCLQSLLAKVEASSRRGLRSLSLFQAESLCQRRQGHANNDIFKLSGRIQEKRKIEPEIEDMGKSTSDKCPEWKLKSHKVQASAKVAIY